MVQGMRLKAEHGIVCSMPRERFGYFGWPSIARTGDGDLVVGTSGLRLAHVCPWGKTVLFRSCDDGRTWSFPRVLNDTPLDDRDCGVVSLGGRRLLVTWFSLDVRKWLTSKWHAEQIAQYEDADDALTQWRSVCDRWDDATVKKWWGSWVRVTEDGESWSDFIRVSVNTPHGPIVLASGELLYLGKCYLRDQTSGPIRAIRSANGGRTWQDLGVVPNPEGARNENFAEPHVAELPSGRLVGLIRSRPWRDNFPDFHMYQTESDDGGSTWSRARATGIYGSPAHLLVHSSGTLVCSYGHRMAPYGIRAMLSRDGGRTWQADLVLRDDGASLDLGYPASVELPDGSLFMVYYYHVRAGEKCSLLWTRWKLPGQV